MSVSSSSDESDYNDMMNISSLSDNDDSFRLSFFPPITTDSDGRILDDGDDDVPG